VDVKWIQNAIVQLTECEQQIKWTTSPKVFVEVALLIIANEQKNEQESVQQAVSSSEVKQLTERLQALEQQLERVKENGVQEATQKERRKPAPKPQSTFKVPHEQIRTVLDNAGKAEIVKVRNEWANFLEQLKAANPQAHATIQHTNPAAASNDALIVAFK